MNRRSWGVFAVLCIGAFAWIGGHAAMAADAPKAPDFTGADGWINTDKPISIADLKGHVVLLDFWTYCCINCMHVFPDLKYIEQKYKDQPVVVIGVHSGKFEQEKDAEHIKSAVLRHNIEHPVAVDSDYKIWNAYGVHSWPTLVLIDPEGKVIGGVSGEGNRDVLDRVISATLDKYKGKGVLAATPLTFKKERETFKSGVLEFPGKILADATGKRLFIADTNHHRVLVADFDGKVSQIIGAGSIGFSDGTFDQAKLYQPQGIALSADGQTLYIADTENHAIRAADLSKHTLTTIAGTGKQGNERHPDGVAKTTALSSPWDLTRVDKSLFIAMAGTHQIWEMDLASGKIKLYAGTGSESSIDGPVSEASFAQPSGIVGNGEKLFVADSESSTVRVVGIKKEGAETTSLAGSNNLFGFGLIDGKGADVRFQHPLGVALVDRTLFVADTFNGVIRQIDLKTGQVSRWLGTGKSDPGEPTSDKIGLFEPAGLSEANGTLYIADTNHHRIVAVDLKTKALHVLNVQLPK